MRRRDGGTNRRGAGDTAYTPSVASGRYSGRFGAAPAGGFAAALGRLRGSALGVTTAPARSWLTGGANAASKARPGPNKSRDGAPEGAHVPEGTGIPQGRRLARRHTTGRSSMRQALRPRSGPLRERGREQRSRRIAPRDGERAHVLSRRSVRPRKEGISG